ncbi:tRNA pseudouridine(55) synthase TruB [Croceicoccus ponticola]|uniref:tRNA pseudouridine synthase B n=1 Tax=Croceicoccus ponticola TaxID=2217664 RepID=A0A437GUQ8_9SPHN|nr:tRNA pseudouridine(55) synthase TruB [Croceicoccus ponticola]RVQ64885.1 tRNA pseudouridine(55) synthase TruB [Croceicoccus ponticola]
MPNGWIILDKPLTLGSTQAVAAVKRNLREAGYGKVKVGHGGTLDPLATGVLPIAVGEATKLAGRMLDATKAYEFTVQFGTETTTLDAEGEICATSDVRPTRAEVEAILPDFTGPIEQMPPAYSALKINGKRAYDLARAGEDVVLEARSVTIHALDVMDWTEDSVTLLANVSKGTYIRSLARDIACELGSVGYVTMLRRVKAGPFTLESAISLDKLNDLAKGASLEDIILPLEAGLDDIPALDLDPDAAGAVRQGRKLSGLPQPDGTYWGRLGDEPVALMEVEGGEARVLRGFNLKA